MKFLKKWPAELRCANLIYHGQLVPGYFMGLPSGRLFKFSKSKKGPWQELGLTTVVYSTYRISNPFGRKPKQIRIGAAQVLESAGNKWRPGLEACHLPGFKPSDIQLGCCIFGTKRDNRAHRLKDGTWQTSNTTPHKYRHMKDEILAFHRAGASVNEIVDYLHARGVTAGREGLAKFIKRSHMRSQRNGGEPNSAQVISTWLPNSH